jgi:SAM-dependent methyltransferase
MGKRFAGSGPGAQTADGCSVELYRRMPYLDDLAPVEHLLVPGIRVLDLGAGTGRLAGRLLALGCAPTAVDDSAEMLACCPAGVATVHSPIESLSLPDRFDVVLLSSCLINHPLAATRLAMAQTMRAHLKAGGHAVLQRHDPVWLRSAPVGWVGRAGAAEVAVVAVARQQDEVHMTLRYRLEASEWTHEFTAILLDEPAIERLLAEAGFAPVHWHGADRRWASAATPSAATQRTAT